MDTLAGFVPNRRDETSSKLQQHGIMCEDEDMRDNLDSVAVREGAFDDRLDNIVLVFHA